MLRKVNKISSVRQSQKGFSLLELLVVFAILGLLMGLVGTQVLGVLGTSKVKTARLQINDFEQSLEIFLLDVGRYPTRDEGLQALIKKPDNAPGWNGPYLKDRSIPLDPWQRPYTYQFPGENAEVDIYSLGRDGEPGGTGEDADANNWE